MTLRIKDWDLHFENNRTRELKNLMWVPFPNNHDGDGFTELISNKNGIAIFGAWVLIVQVASKCDPRGTLLRGNKKDHNLASLSRMTRGPEQTFKQAIPILLNIGWIEEIDLKTGIPHDSAVIPQEGAQKGREGKGIEGNEINTLISSVIEFLNSKTDKKFKPSTKSTRESISARSKEGYSFEDFKKVIEKKCKEWIGTEYEKYLCPSTLFRPDNFEKYLNQGEFVKQTLKQKIEEELKNAS